MERLLWVDKATSRLTKAKNADVLAYEVEDFDASPNYFAAGGDLKDALRVSDTNPFQKDYAWGRSELIDYTTSAANVRRRRYFIRRTTRRGRSIP